MSILKVKRFRSKIVFIVLLSSIPDCFAQTTSFPSVERALQTPVQASSVTNAQMRQFLMARIPSLPKPRNAQQWRVQEKQLRDHVLKIAFHGWPPAWINSAPHFEQVGVIETNHGYRIRKLRYEIVPGFFSTALLYEPETSSGPHPAILNLFGHEPAGTAVEYEQKRCYPVAITSVGTASAAGPWKLKSYDQ